MPCPREEQDKELFSGRLLIIGYKMNYLIFFMFIVSRFDIFRGFQIVWLWLSLIITLIWEIIRLSITCSSLLFGLLLFAHFILFIENVLIFFHSGQKESTNVSELWKSNNENRKRSANLSTMSLLTQLLRNRKLHVP